MEQSEKIEKSEKLPKSNSESSTASSKVVSSGSKSDLEVRKSEPREESTNSKGKDKKGQILQRAK